ILTGCDSKQNDVSVLETTGSTVTFQLGTFICTVIKDGETSISAFDFFSGVERENMRGAFEEYGQDPEAFVLSLQVLVIDTGDNLVLIDTGLGEPVYSDEGKLIESLQALDISPEEIDVVIITHGHWDHIGGIADKEGNLCFPNARHIMSRTDWEFWTNELYLLKEDERLGRWARENLPPLEGSVELMEENSEIVSGISIIAAPGHTLGQIAVSVKSEGQQLLCVGDVVHNHMQMTYPDIGYVDDENNDQAVSTRKSFIEHVIKDHILVYGCHFSFPGLGYVEKIDGKHVWSWMEVNKPVIH
ncbi:MBL fold metallo-hydrolase, partial [Acidobacteriota bacterium]